MSVETDQNFMRKIQPEQGLAVELSKTSQSVDYRAITQSIPRDIQSGQNFENSEFIKSAMAELEDNPELADAYREILLRDNVEYLKCRSQEILTSLKGKFFEGAHILNYFAYKKRKAKLEIFSRFVSELKPVRGDKPDLSYDEFKSPRKTGKIVSFGDQDVIAQADNYVYGSFDGLRHYMSEHSGKRYELSEEDAKTGGQILMQDIANIRARSRDRNTIKNYLNNLFNYQTGKEILAVYLASVFDSPIEAAEFIARNNNPMEAQHWDEDRILTYPADLLQNKNLNVEELNSLANQKCQNIVDKMKELNQDFGIEPPLSLEVRIQGLAKIIK